MGEAKARAKSGPTLADRIGVKATRKQKARREGTGSVWSGLGMSGLVGWSIALPALLGTALGIWLDRSHPGAHPWTLALLVAGLALGCLNAWRWIAREADDMERREGHDDE